MYYPSEFPQPAKSKVNKVISWHKMCGMQERLFLIKNVIPFNTTATVAM